MKDISIFWHMLKEIRGQRLLMALAIFLYVPVTLLSLAQPLLIAGAAQYGLQGESLGVVTYYASLFLAAVVGLGVCETVQIFVMQLLGQRFVKAIRQRMFERAQRFPIAYLDKTPLGRLLARMTNDVDSVSELFSSGAVSVVGDALFLGGTLIMLFIVDVKLSLASLVTLPLLLVGLKFLRRWIRDALHWVRASYARLAGFLQEHYSGMQTIQLFAQTARKRADFESQNNEYMLANRRAILLDSLIYSFVDGISYLTLASVILTASWLHDKNWLTVGVLVAFIEALNRFFVPVRELANRFAIFQSAMVSVERIAEFLAISIETRRDAPFMPALFQKELAFESVNFDYGEGKGVLNEVSFKVRKGEHIALVGRTGAGKSTVAKLLPRFYEIGSGHIRFDGVDSRQMDVFELRSLFNVVPQEVFLFSGTIRDNLLYGRKGTSDAEIEAALRRCQALDVVMKHGGLDGAVAPGAHQFSLGEKQLLALARALIAEPQILILDEATASVDPVTERKLQWATAEVLKERTAFIIAHRLSTIESCNRILVFQKGRIEESGTHEELIAANGYYARLVELQKKEEALGIGNQ